MKPFRTVVTPEKSPFLISHRDRIVSIGSCFSENIGRKFGEYKFAINVNPFGQQYNPHSIAAAIERLLEPVPYTENDLVYHDELYHSFDHHGSFSRSTVAETLQVINDNLRQASEDLKKASVLFLTFGTSHVFELKDTFRTETRGNTGVGKKFSAEEQGDTGVEKAFRTETRGNTGVGKKFSVEEQGDTGVEKAFRTETRGNTGVGKKFSAEEQGDTGVEKAFRTETRGNTGVVSNCHKLSGTQFTKRLMTPDEIVSVMHAALSKLSTVNRQLSTVLTVSPVRYFAFGHHENTVSKAHLFSAIHQLQEKQPDYFYFPAYELVMDDLRDYRFFAEDMLHPNYQATDYVWEKLCTAMLEPKTLLLMRDMDELLLAARHKPRNPNSEAHKKFVRKNLDKILLLEKEFSLTFEQERKALEKFL